MTSSAQEYSSIGDLFIALDFPQIPPDDMTPADEEYYQSQFDQILSVIQGAYYGSTTFKSIVQNAVANNDQLVLRLDATGNDGAVYVVHDDTVRLDVPQLLKEQDTFFNEFGQEVSFSWTPATTYP